MNLAEVDRIGIASVARWSETDRVNLIELKTEIETSAVEALDGYLLESGLEAWSVYEDVIAKRAWLQGLGSDLEELLRLAAECEAWLGQQGYRRLSVWEQKVLRDQDWKDSYKAHFQASSFGPLHWVPEWERGSYRLPEGHRVLWLDPGLAFGTGNHETTRLCAERLVQWVQTQPSLAGLRVVDAGCGSGILALSARLLGCEEIAAFDLDPEAVRVSRENARLNGLEDRVHFFEADLGQGLGDRQADLLLANIQADVLMQNASLLMQAVAPGGLLVLSGILAGEGERVRAAFAAEGPTWSFETRTLGDWSDLKASRPLL